MWPQFRRPGQLASQMDEDWERWEQLAKLCAAVKQEQSSPLDSALAINDTSRNRPRRDTRSPDYTRSEVGRWEPRRNRSNLPPKRPSLAVPTKAVVGQNYQCGQVLACRVFGSSGESCDFSSGVRWQFSGSVEWFRLTELDAGRDNPAFIGALGNPSHRSPVGAKCSRHPPASC